MFRVPLLIYAPQAVAAPTDARRRPTSHIDLAPTLLALLGAPDAAARMHGVPVWQRTAAGSPLRAGVRLRRRRRLHARTAASTCTRPCPGRSTPATAFAFDDADQVRPGGSASAALRGRRAGESASDGQHALVDPPATGPVGMAADFAPSGPRTPQPWHPVALLGVAATHCPGWSRRPHPGITCALEACTRSDRRLGNGPTGTGSHARHVFQPRHAFRANDELDTRQSECTAERVHRAPDGRAGHDAAARAGARRRRRQQRLGRGAPDEPRPHGAAGGDRRGLPRGAGELAGRRRPARHDPAGRRRRGAAPLHAEPPPRRRGHHDHRPRQRQHRGPGDGQRRVQLPREAGRRRAPLGAARQGRASASRWSRRTAGCRRRSKARRRSRSSSPRAT